MSPLEGIVKMIGILIALKTGWLTLHAKEPYGCETHLVVRKLVYDQSLATPPLRVIVGSDRFCEGVGDK